MKRTYLITVLSVHLGLLVIAAMRLSPVSWLWGDPSLTFDFFELSCGDGAGSVYYGDYTLPVVLTYIAAHGAGLAAYREGCRYFRSRWFRFAAVLCGLGLLSFLLELSHWLTHHHLTAIASCPPANIVLAIVVIVILHRRGRHNPD